MRKELFSSIIIVTLTAVVLTAGQAQAGETERDPFFPSAHRPSAAATRPGLVDDSWGRDPFSNPLANRPPVSSTQKTSPPPSQIRILLSGIIYSKDLRLAIIGGETYREGSKIGDRKLLEIRTRSIVVENSAGEREESLLEEFSINK